MKTHFLTVALLSCVTSLLAQDITYSSTVDEIWGGRVFMELDGQYAGTSRQDTYTTWPTNDQTVMVYCLRVPKAHVRADVVFSPKAAGRTVTFNLRVVRASTGEVVTEHTSTIACTSSAEQTAELMPDFVFPADTWYRFEITSPKGSTNMSRFTKLRFQRKSSLAVGDSPIYMAPSVHLHTYGSTDPMAPSGESYDWIYQEGMIPPEYERPSTYAMIIGTDGGYSGFQSIYNGKDSYGNDKWNHLVLFSVWDNGDVDKDPAMPEYLKSGIVDMGKDVIGVRFGAEGTGSSARLVESDKWWTPGKWVQFLWNARPEQVQVTLKGHDGKDSIASYQNTLQSCWYKMEDDPQWHYLGTLRESGRNRYYTGFYAFLENFYDIGGELVHRAYYRNAAMRSMASGKWYARNTVDFGHTQNDGTRFSRRDYGHGQTQLYDNCFYLETGGFGDVNDSARVLPLPESMPWVDTINIKALTARVDEAISKDEVKQAESRLDLFRKIDMTGWKLVSYTDEETEGEKENGRAAQAVDGRNSTYWHSQWKPSKAPFPHSLVLDAGKDTTVNGLALYQEKESRYRAKAFRLLTSEDGNTWSTRASGTLKDSNNPEFRFTKDIRSRYFKIEFRTSYGGEVLAINEVTFTCPYDLARMMQRAKSTIEMADRLGGYRLADLQHLIEVYDEGRCTDTIAMKDAFAELTDVMPLKYGVVKNLQTINTSRCYQLHNTSKKSVLYASEDGTQTLLVADGDENAMDSCANWLILKSETYNQYCIYNVGTGLYLNTKDGKLTLTTQPVPISITSSSSGFRLGGLSDFYQLLDNYSMAPDMDFAFDQLEKSEFMQHFEKEIGELCAEAVQTYGQAFEYKVGTTDLGKAASRWTSNVNVSNNTEHPISYMLDGSKATYYETWYSGITWPAEPSYIQLRFTTNQSAIRFKFIPSQNANYGQTDMPAEMTILASEDNKTWEQVANLTEGFPTSISDIYTSPVIPFGKPCMYVRFQVNKTFGNRDGKNKIFAISEMKVYSASENQENSLYYNNEEVKNAVDAMMTVLDETHAAVKASEATMDNYQALRDAIDEAQRVMQDVETGIDIISSPGSCTYETLYDLQGRRVLVPRGLNIVRCSDGTVRKMLTK
ncbi:MAG: discoidin domain-containing protein [Bacteroidaceae bacterium]|nr:discoidin domain-containing protein [Bacteroidaceae bacterium]